jgi:hypothetical protein
VPHFSPAFTPPHFCSGVYNRLPHLGSKGTYLKQMVQDKLIEHKQYIDKHGQDMPEVRNWKWMVPSSNNVDQKSVGMGSRKRGTNE